MFFPSVKMLLFLVVMMIQTTADIKLKIHQMFLECQVALQQLYLRNQSLKLLAKITLIWKPSTRIFFQLDNLSISNCMNTSNNRDYANLTSMESIYRKYQCTNDVVVSLNPLYDVASTTSSGTLYLTKYVAENFAINNQVQLVGCSDAIYNRNYTVSEVVEAILYKYAVAIKYNMFKCNE